MQLQLKNRMKEDFNVEGFIPFYLPLSQKILKRNEVFSIKHQTCSIKHHFSRKCQIASLKLRQHFFVQRIYTFYLLTNIIKYLTKLILLLSLTMVKKMLLSHQIKKKKKKKKQSNFSALLNFYTF